MARYIDDISFSTIRELILLNNVEIIQHIQQDTPFLQRLFEVYPSLLALPSPSFPPSSSPSSPAAPLGGFLLEIPNRQPINPEP